MQLLDKPDQVWSAIEKVKAGASAFCTNFFPSQSKLESWIARRELSAAEEGGLALFLRRDRDFWHLFFCAASPASLQTGLIGCPELQSKPVVVDLIGNEKALAELEASVQSAGLRPYTALIRLARPAVTALPTADSDAPVTCAEAGDVQAVAQLIESAFDRYADQLPSSDEWLEALTARQVLAVKAEGILAALLFYETQGFTSTIRYWAVAKEFRSRRFGAALIRQYFAIQPAARRFTLWVNQNNDNAIQKYRHYGYAPDGLRDHILANRLIAA